MKSSSGQVHGWNGMICELLFFFLPKDIMTIIRLSVVFV